MWPNAGKGLTMSGNACAAFVGKIENLRQVFYDSSFPNMLLSLHPEYVMVHQLWPQSPERTLIVCDWFFHPAAFTRKDFNPEDAIEFWDMTNKQDWQDRKSTRLNSSHVEISYAVFCLKKKRQDGDLS